MAICVKQTTVDTTPGVLQVDTSTTDLNSCAYVLQSGADYKNSQFLNLSIEDGAAIGGAIVACWTVAFCIRALINFIKESDNERSEN